MLVHVYMYTVIWICIHTCRCKCSLLYICLQSSREFTSLCCSLLLSVYLSAHVSLHAAQHQHACMHACMLSQAFKIKEVKTKMTLLGLKDDGTVCELRTVDSQGFRG